MCSQTTANRFAFNAGKSISLKDGFPPLSVGRPVSRSLPKSSFIAFVVPVILSSKQAHIFVFAVFGACVFSSIRLVKNIASTNWAGKFDSSIAFIWSWTAYFRKTNFISSFFRSGEADVPCCAFSSSKVRWPKPRDFKICKPLAHRSPRKTKLFTDSFRANAIRCIHLFKDFLGWLCSHINTLARNVCTATNTWRRAALSTW